VADPFASGPPPGRGPRLEAVTGMVLCGGLARRMGGVDKGLQQLHGQPLALRALERLHPQVNAVALNANRHLDRYAQASAPVWPDVMPDHLGPLCGMLTGLERMSTPWLVTVPCDVPDFPEDLVARLVASAQEQGVRVAVAASPDATLEAHTPDGEPRRHPVFCLLHRDLRDTLRQALEQGERRVDRWTASCGRAVVPFPDGRAFTNLNTLADLASHQG
jgi:molybdenum cofactor guanylyltransferase